MSPAHSWLRASVDLAELALERPEVTDFLRALSNRCVELLPVVAVGTMLADQDGTIRATTSSYVPTEPSALAADREDGPCGECYRSGRPFYEIDLRQTGHRWPGFTEAALQRGFTKVAALPLRHRGDVVGAMQLLGYQDLPAKEEIDLAQHLADVAMLTLAQAAALHQATTTAGQLRHALTSRVVIEQAKGMLAAQWNTGPEEAFTALRRYARGQQRKLHEVAEDVVARRLRVPQA